MESTRNAVSWDLVESVEGLVIEIAAELNLPNFVEELPEEYNDRLLWEFIIFCYDLTFYLVNTISDNLLHDVSEEVMNSDENITYITDIDTEFYNRTLTNADDELSNQIETIVNTMTEVSDTMYPNLTREDALYFTDILKGKLYRIVYPDVWDPCRKFGVEIFNNYDLAFLTEEYMADNLARVDIYYESLKVEVVKEQKAYELFSIVCDLGGALGLFFGASLVAFVEAIDFWFIRGCCGPKKK